MQSESVLLYLNTISQYMVGSSLQTTIQQSAFTNYPLLKNVFEKLNTNSQYGQKFFNFTSYSEYNQSVFITGESYEINLDDRIREIHQGSKQFSEEEVSNLVQSVSWIAIFAYELSLPLLLNTLNLVRHSGGNYKLLLAEATLKLNEYVRLYPHDRSIPFLTNGQLEKCRQIFDRNPRKDKLSYEDVYILPIFYSGALVLYYALSGKDLESSKQDIENGLKDLQKFSNTISNMKYGSLIVSMLMVFSEKQSVREFKNMCQKLFGCLPCDKSAFSVSNPVSETTNKVNFSSKVIQIK